jgi:hypothetical protein
MNVVDMFSFLLPLYWWGGRGQKEAIGKED